MNIKCNTTYLFKNSEAKVVFNSTKQELFQERKLKRQKVLDFLARAIQFRKNAYQTEIRKRKLDGLEYRKSPYKPDEPATKGAINRHVEEQFFKKFHCHTWEIIKRQETITRDLDRFYALVENHERSLVEEKESELTIDKERYTKQELLSNVETEPRLRKYIVKCGEDYVSIFDTPNNKLTPKQLLIKRNREEFKRYVNLINRALEKVNKREFKNGMPITFLEKPKFMNNILVGKTITVKGVNYLDVKYDWETNIFEDKWENTAPRYKPEGIKDVERMTMDQLKAINTDNFPLTKIEAFRRYGPIGPNLLLSPQVCKDSKEWIIRICETKEIELPTWRIYYRK